jgi:hypothetical protein
MNANSKARTVSFDEDFTDPYVIGHLDAQQLADECLKSRLLEFKAESGLEITEAEDFEEFLSWLDDRYDYFQIIVTDAMIHF